MAPRVILAAYGELAEDGIVEMRPRSGIYVSRTAGHGIGVDAQLGWLTEVLAGAMKRGIPPLDLPARLTRSLATLQLRAAAIECNDDQLVSMSAELRRDYGIDATPIELEVVTSGGPLPLSLRSADLLVTTSPHAATVGALAARLGIPHIAITMCTDLFAEVGRLLAHGPVYFVVADPRFEQKLRANLGTGPHRSNLRTLVCGRDDLGAILPTAPMYLTKLARQALAGSPLVARSIPEARVFSDESARELLDFVLRVNLATLASRDAA